MGISGMMLKWKKGDMSIEMMRLVQAAFVEMAWVLQDFNESDEHLESDSGCLIYVLPLCVR